MSCNRERKTIYDTSHQIFNLFRTGATNINYKTKGKSKTYKNFSSDLNSSENCYY